MNSVISTTSQAEIIVTEETGDITVVTTPSTPQLITSFTEGPQGPAGAGGLTFIQSSPLATWTINHNFGFMPSVEVFDAGGQLVEAEISHPTTNQTVVTLNPASAGTARLT